MSAELAHESWTVADLWELPDDGHRCEIVDGPPQAGGTPSLVGARPPTNRHQAIATRLLVAWSACRPPGAEATHAAGVHVPATAGAREHLLIPDVLVVREDAAGEHYDPTDVLIAAEVVSPSSRVRDRHTERGLYADLGVAEYWVLDPERGT